MESELSFYVPLIYGLMVFIGLIGCFFGFKLFRLMLVIVMAFSCGVLGGWLGFSLSMEPLIWSAVGLALGAVIGGVLAFFFYSVGVGILGALFVCASLMPYLQTLDPLLQAAVLLVCGLVAAYAAVSVTNLAIQLVTAMLGAFLAVQGVLFFLQGRVSESWIPGTTTWELDLIFTPLAGLAALVLGAVGFFFQRRAATS
jgi:hypothetical protein